MVCLILSIDDYFLLERGLNIMASRTIAMALNPLADGFDCFMADGMGALNRGDGELALRREEVAY